MYIECIKFKKKQLWEYHPLCIEQETKVIKYRNYIEYDQWSLQNGDLPTVRGGGYAKWSQATPIIIICLKIMYKVEKKKGVSLLFRDMEVNIKGTKSRND